MKLVGTALIGLLSLALQGPSLNSAVRILLDAVREDTNEWLRLFPEYTVDTPFLVDVGSLVDAARAARAGAVDRGAAERELPARSRVLALPDAYENATGANGKASPRIREGAVAVKVDSITPTSTGVQVRVSTFFSTYESPSRGWNTNVRRIRVHLERSGGKWTVARKEVVSQS